jgi:hypothetical protein
MAQYALLDDQAVESIKGSPRKIFEGPFIQVHNSTITQGKKVDSYGIATYLGDMKFRVDFPMPEVDKLSQSQEFNAPPEGFFQDDGPNYIIDQIWTNCHGDYIFAVVTDSTRNSLYILSRYPNPSLVAYSQVMEYVVTNYDRDRLVQTPHYF